MSNVSRTLKTLRDDSYICDIVERYNPFTKRRNDLFGFIDLIAIKENEIIGVQCCSGSSHAAHKKKILASEYFPLWLNAGGKVQLRSWRKVKTKKGGMATKWKERVEAITND